MTKRINKPFLDALASGPLVSDGANGTVLYERGMFINKALEEAALSKPNLLRQVHEEYIEAGAQLIQTHTFGANKLKLARYDAADRFEAINARATEIALEAAAGRAYVGGSIGPTGTMPGVVTDDELKDLRDLFAEQATILVDHGVHVVVLETFRLLSEMRVAIEAVKSVTDRPIIAQMAFDAEQRTADGADPGRAVDMLKSWGASVVGANCVEGPDGLFKVVEQMVGRGLPVSAQPNAGYPRKQDDRLIYMATPEYFGVYARRFLKAGVSLVGGCCGTRPDHIRRVAMAARMMGGGPTTLVEVAPTAPVDEEAAGLEPIPLANKSKLAAKIDRVYRERVKGDAPLTPDNFVVSVEVNPPPGLNPAAALEAAKMLRDHGVDVINIADGPRASVRMSNQALGLLVQSRLDMEVILHVCCRDRNLLGLQSDLLANHVLGLSNLVIITGDPPKLGDYPHATAVFDLDSIELLRLANGLNRGIDPAGKMVGEATSFVLACGAEPAALDYNRELRRLEKKMEAGAELIMTQPVYDANLLNRFLDDIAYLDLPVLVGLLPLASARNAEFLHNEVPGMQVPEHIRERMREADKGPRARAEGIKIAQETLMSVADRVVGAYIMPPFGRYAAALSILECVGYDAPKTTTKRKKKRPAKASKAK